MQEREYQSTQPVVLSGGSAMRLVNYQRLEPLVVDDETDTRINMEKDHAEQARLVL